MRRLQHCTIVALAMMAVSSFALPSASASDQPDTIFRIHDRGVLCRSARVLEARFKYVVPGFRGLGARGATMTQYRDAVRALRIAACTPPVRAAAVRDALVMIGTRWDDALREISTAKGFTYDQAEAAVFAQLGYELEQLTTACGTDLEAGMIYILEGSGSAAFNAAVGPNCDRSASVPTIRDASNLVDPDPRLQNCFSMYADETSECGGWVSDDEPEDPQPPRDDPPPPTPQEPPADDDGTGNPVLDVGIASAEIAQKMGKALASIGAMIVTFGQGHKAAEAYGKFIGGIGLGMYVVGATAEEVYRGLADYMKDDTNGNGNPNDDGNNKMCPSMNFASQPPAFTSNDQGGATSVQDVMQQCICDTVSRVAVERASGPGDTIVGGGWLGSMIAHGVFTMQQNGYCMSQGEKTRLECLRYPYDDNDGIRRECRDVIREANNHITDGGLADKCSALIQCPFNSHYSLVPPPVWPEQGYRCTCQSDLLIPGNPGNGNNNECNVLTCAYGTPFFTPGMGCRCPGEPQEPRPPRPEPWF